MKAIFPIPLSFWFAIGLAGALTLTNQVWVGSTTLYSEQRRANREELHERILANPPSDSVDATWGDLGASGTNVRFLTVWVAEAFHQVTGANVNRSYYIIETGSLFLCFLLLFVYLGGRVGQTYALFGVMFFGAVLPLTYFFHYFHPWDRPSLAMWLIVLILIDKRHYTVLFPTLAIAMLIKYDIILLPTLYFLATVSRDRWRRTSIETAALFALTFGIFWALKASFPGGAEAGSMLGQVAKNLATIKAMHFYYPPFLALGLPVVLTVYGFSKADNFARAAVVFACLQAMIMFPMSNFVEIRAEMPILILLLPAALVGLGRVFDETDGIRRNVNVQSRS